MTGPSGAGKTTLIEQLIRRFVAAGDRVGAIKHTHHPLNDDEDRGDTGRFRRAGAERVMLAGQGEAVIFQATGTARIAYAHPADLLAHFDCEIVLIEGFKNDGDWPRFSIEAGARPDVEELATKLDRIRGR